MESSNFLGCLENKAQLLVAIRRNHSMECGCLKDKRFTATWWRKLDGFSVIKLKIALEEIIFWQENQEFLGRLRQTGDNARKFSLVCDDRNPGFENIKIFGNLYGTAGIKLNSKLKSSKWIGMGRFFAWLNIKILKSGGKSFMFSYSLA